MMELSERIRNYDKDIMSVLKDNPKDEWADDAEQLEAENKALSELMNDINDELLVLEKKNEALMKLASMYIKSYEDLVFGNAIKEGE